MARDPQGRFLGIPYNWSRPTGQDLRKGFWDRDDHRIITPRTYGWGYDINFAEITRRLARRPR